MKPELDNELASIFIVLLICFSSLHHANRFKKHKTQFETENLFLCLERRMNTINWQSHQKLEKYRVQGHVGNCFLQQPLSENKHCKVSTAV